MTRPLRIEYKNAWYHVMNRGRQAERTYRCVGDYQDFLGIVQEVIKMWDIRIAAYCLMTNHYHLLVQTPKGNLSRCMRHINGVYTQQHNRKYHKDGQLFRGRYKAILVDADSYLLELMRYIHRNPVRAGRVKNPGDYPWSSYCAYISKAKKWKWIEKEMLLEMLEKNKARQQSAYRKFVKSDDSEFMQKVFTGDKTPSILGSDKFVNFIKKQYYKVRKDREIPQARSLAPDISRIKKAVCKAYKVNIETLVRCRRGETNEARSVLLYLIRKHTGAKLGDIGTNFNISNYSSVSGIIVRMRDQIGADKKLQNRLRSIEQMLS